MREFESLKAKNREVKNELYEKEKQLEKMNKHYKDLCTHNLKMLK